ncbi:MAG TPA: hypothetical protein VFZ04_05020 [Longimicrobiales bacterium]
MNAFTKSYRLILHALPRRFRERYGDEMTDIAVDRIAAGGITAWLAECASVLVAAVRLRLHAPQLQWTAATAMALTLLLLRGSTGSAGNFEVTATDPAGEFTLVVRDGRAVGGSIDRQPLAPSQLVHAGDSIRVLAQTGSVLFAVAYDPDKSSIAWEPRPAHCRGRALNCGVTQ